MTESFRLRESSNISVRHHYRENNNKQATTEKQKRKEGNHVVAPRSSSSRLFHPSLRQRQRVSFFFPAFPFWTNSIVFMFCSSNGLLWFVAFRLPCFFYFYFCCWGEGGRDPGPNCHGIWVSQKAENPTSRVVVPSVLLCVQTVNRAPGNTRNVSPSPTSLLQFQKSK